MSLVEWLAIEIRASSFFYRCRTSFFYAVLIGMLAVINGGSLAASRKLVLIPGIMGSRLCDSNGKGDLVWGDEWSYTFSRMEKLRLPDNFDPETLPIRSCGIIKKVTMLPMFWESEVYSSLIDFLKDPKKFSYDDNNILIFSYDWRLSNVLNARRLEDFINDNTKKGEQVDIIAHSMGGLIGRIYVQTLSGEKKVRHLILLGAPQRGSAKVFQRLFEGFDYWPSILSGGGDQIRATILSFPSFYELLPEYDNCCAWAKDAKSRPDYFSIYDPKVWQRFGWLPNDLKTEKGQRFIARNLEAAAKLKAILARRVFQNFDRELADLHFVATPTKNTWSRVFFDPKTGAFSDKVVRPGDGSVTLFSATAGVPDRYQASLREHELIWESDTAKSLIEAALSDREWTASTTAHQSLVDDDKIEHEVAGTTMEIMPRAVSQGQKISLKITCETKEKIGAMRLNDQSAKIMKGNNEVGSLALKVSFSGERQIVLSGEFNAPSELGPYEVRAVIPDLPGLQTIFGVVAP